MWIYNYATRLFVVVGLKAAASCSARAVYPPSCGKTSDELSIQFILNFDNFNVTQL
jgi:hypothetical protein